MQLTLLYRYFYISKCFLPEKKKCSLKLFVENNGLGEKLVKIYLHIDNLVITARDQAKICASTGCKKFKSLLHIALRFERSNNFPVNSIL